MAVKFYWKYVGIYMDALMTKLFYSASYDVITPSGICFTLLRVLEEEKEEVNIFGIIQYVK